MNVPGDILGDTYPKNWSSFEEEVHHIMRMEVKEAELSSRDVLALIAGSPSLSAAQLRAKANDWLRTHRR